MSIGGVWHTAVTSKAICIQHNVLRSRMKISERKLSRSNISLDLVPPIR